MRLLSFSSKLIIVVPISRMHLILMCTLVFIFHKITTKSNVAIYYYILWLIYMLHFMLLI